MRLTSIAVGAAFLFEGASATRPAKHQTGRISVYGSGTTYRGCIDQNFYWHNVEPSACGTFEGTFTFWDPESRTFYLMFGLQGFSNTLIGSMDVTFKNENNLRCGGNRNKQEACASGIKYAAGLFSGSVEPRGITLYEYIWFDSPPAPGQKVPLYSQKKHSGQHYIFPTWITISNHTSA